MEEILLQIPAKLNYAQIASQLSRNICQGLKKQEIDKDFLYSMEIAVSEACTNAIKQSVNTDDGGMIAISFEISQDKIVTKVKNKGKGFDLDNVPEPDFENHPEGGYGIYIIKAKMDKVENIIGIDCNVLSMTKYFKRSKNGFQKNSDR